MPIQLLGIVFLLSSIKLVLSSYERLPWFYSIGENLGKKFPQLLNRPKHLIILLIYSGNGSSVHVFSWIKLSVKNVKV